MREEVADVWGTEIAQFVGRIVAESGIADGIGIPSLALTGAEVPTPGGAIAEGYLGPIGALERERELLGAVMADAKFGRTWVTLG